MAKGNDGNYLQHCIEVEAAVRLAQMDSKGRLHIALTHGMAPFEGFEIPFETPKPGLTRKLLKQALLEAGKPPQQKERSLVTAYRKAKTSIRKYPNSAELLRVVIGSDNLSGGITEVVRKKHKKLANVWSGSSVVPVLASWRKEVYPGGMLACPDNLQIPWLFSMDPMTYSENGREDDNRLHRCDIDTLSNVLSQYVRSGRPGIAALFVYNVSLQVETQFWRFVDDLAKRVSAGTCSYWLTHRWGNRNLAGLLYTDIELSSGFAPPCLNAGRRV